MNNPRSIDFEMLLEQSELLPRIAKLRNARGKSRLFGDEIRALTAEEIHALEKQGNRSSDWSRILVTDGFVTDWIHSTEFQGNCVVGVLDGSPREVEKGVHLPSGISRCTISDSEIGHGCLIHDVGLVSYTLICEDAVLFRTDAITESRSHCFGQGIPLSVGQESGGRHVLSFAEMTIPLAEAVAMKRGDSDFQSAYAEFIQTFVDQCKVPFNIIESGAVIRHAGKMEDVFVGAGSVIDGALQLKNCTLLGDAEDPIEIGPGVIVRDTCLQWGCRIDSSAIVERSFFIEHASAEKHAKVTHSIIGPNSSIGAGEVTSSLVGPFVGFHHQALLIAALWPEGKGNVGYGANVGSNHTSKAPDQEIRCGEGLFFGLGVNVKFPANYSESPYSIIATAVNTLPQRVAFPFSLINTVSKSFERLSPAVNEIFPGWVLSGNIYAVLRNENKYKERHQARRSTIETSVFRPDIVDLMVIARDALTAVLEKKPFYLSGDIHGLGKNVVTESSRRRGVSAYEMYIEFYALSGLFDRLEAGGLGDGPSYTSETEDPLWEHQRHLIIAEGWNQRSVQENLERLKVLMERIARDTERAKASDDGRGRRIIPDYDEASILAKDDPHVKRTWKETTEKTERIQRFLADMGGS